MRCAANGSWMSWSRDRGLGLSLNLDFDFSMVYGDELTSTYWYRHVQIVDREQALVFGAEGVLKGFRVSTHPKHHRAAFLV